MSYNLTGAAYGGNVCLAAAGLAGTAANTTVSTTNALNYTIKGQLYAHAALGAAAPNATDLFTGKPFVPLQIGQAAVVAAFIDASQNLRFAQGPAVNTNDLTGGLAALQFPQVSDLYAPIGYFLVKSDPAAALATWTFGVNNFTGVTGVTVTARDVMDYPAQPITG